MKLPIPVVLSVFLMVACKNSDAPAKSQVPESAVKKVIVDTPPGAGETGGIVWIENDYPKALAAAKARNLPMVVDMWAAWCHTCLAMKKGTLRDPGLAALAEQFIWLAIDTEDPSSAAVMEKFPPKVWPTFSVVSPVDESVQATQLGSCSVRAFREFLDRGASGHRAQLGDKLSEDSPLFHLREGDRAVQKSEYKAASASFALALKKGGPEWGLAASTLKKQISALARLEDKRDCAKLAVETLDTVAKDLSSASTDYMYYANECVEALPKDQQQPFRLRILMQMDAVLGNNKASISIDDRSDALANSRAMALAMDQKDVAMTYARTQQTLLNDAIANASSALEELTYIWHQVEVNVYLQEGDKVLAWVEALEQKLPSEYDPPYRKGWLLYKLGRYAQAHESLARALPLAHGARRGRILTLDAEVYNAEGNAKGEKTARQAALTYYQSLPAGQRRQSYIDQAQTALDKLK